MGPGWGTHHSNTFTQSYGSRELDAASTLLIVRTGFLPPDDPRVVGTVDAVRNGAHIPYRLITPDAPQQATLLRVLDVLAEEYVCLTGLPLEAYSETLRNLLSVILVRLVHLADPRRQARTGDGPFHLFRQAVEEDFHRTHRVEDYAIWLGYSIRTLTRATEIGKTIVTAAVAAAFRDLRVAVLKPAQTGVAPGEIVASHPYPVRGGKQAADT